MSDHPLFILVRSMIDDGGQGMEIRERPFSRGAALRVWFPDFNAAGRATARASAMGLETSLPMPHYELESLKPEGAQVVVTIPPSMLGEAQQAMVDAYALPAGTPAIEGTLIELGPAPEE